MPDSSSQPIDTEAVRRLADAATPGPWEAYNANEGTEYLPAWEVANDAYHNPPTDDDTPWVAVHLETGVREDAEFIAAARTAVPALLAELEEARRERDELVLAVKARDIAVREADRLRAAAETALANVRHLHQPYRGVPDFDICAGCSIGMEVRAWPCPTIAALEGTDGS